MKQILLTLMTLASLIIATQAQTETKVTPGAVTGTARSSDGSFTVFHGPPVVTLSVGDAWYLTMKAARTAEIDAMELPTVLMPNGIAFRKSLTTKEYNQDGR